MVRVSFAIQAHPARTEMAEALRDEVGGNCEIVWDPDPDAEIKSPWRSYRHALLTTPEWASHRMIVQDDVLVSKRLREAVNAAVTARPDRLICFFVGNNPAHFAQRVMEACREDKPWAELTHGHWMPVVATCWPAGMAREMVEYNDQQTHWPERFTSDDERVGRFITEIRHFPVASVPSLVEHPDTNPSLIGTRNRGGLDPGRVAACWIGNCADCDDPTLIDWTV